MPEEREISKSGREIVAMLNTNFFYGICFNCCFIGFFQDLLGKKQYIALVESGWVNIHPIVWIFPMFFFLLMSEASKRRIK